MATKIERLTDLYELASKPNISYYTVLGIEKDFDEKELKKVYRKLSMICHPDNFVSESATVQKMAQDCSDLIIKMYNVLLDPVTKDHYDKTGTLLDDRALSRMRNTRRHAETIEALFEDIPEFKRVKDETIIQQIPARLAYHGGDLEFEYAGQNFTLKIPQGTIPGTAFILREVLGNPIGQARKGNLTVIITHKKSSVFYFDQLDVVAVVADKDLKFDENGFLVKAKVGGKLLDTSDEVISHSKKSKMYKVEGLGVQNPLFTKKGNLIIKLNK